MQIDLGGKPVAKCASDITWLASEGFDEIVVDLPPGTCDGIIAPAATIRGRADGVTFSECDFRGAILALSGNVTVRESALKDADVSDNTIVIG